MPKSVSILPDDHVVCAEAGNGAADWTDRNEMRKSQLTTAAAAVSE